MGIRSLLVVGAKKIMKRKQHHFQRQQEFSHYFSPLSSPINDDQFSVPKGHIAVYVSGGDDYSMKRLVVPVSYVNHPKFGELLDRAEAEFGGFDHPMGAITLPCDEDAFFRLLSLPVF
ncbi:Auxin-responsive protein SAUR15 [Linum perenne]